MSKYTYNKSSKFLGTFSSHQHSCKDLSYFAQNIYHHYPRSCMMLQGREINKFLGLAAKGATKSINRRRNQGRVSNVTYVYHLTYPTALLQCHWRVCLQIHLFLSQPLHVLHHLSLIGSREERSLLTKKQQWDPRQSGGRTNAMVFIGVAKVF